MVAKEGAVSGMQIRWSRSTQKEWVMENLILSGCKNSIHPSQVAKSLKKVTIKTGKELKDTQGTCIRFSVELSPS